MVQASLSGHFQAFDATALDIVIVGTRNSGAANTLEALDKDTGSPVWSFDNSPAQLGDGKQIGIISGAASIDYAGKRIYFASRKKSGALGSTDTLWCLDISGGAPELLWAKSLGNIDGSPVLFGGAVGSIADNGLTAAINWQVTGADVPAPSTPLYVPGTGKLIVGSGDGHLYQLDAFVPLPPARVKLGIGSAGMGVPVVDIRKSMICVGTEEGVVYGVNFPIP